MSFLVCDREPRDWHGTFASPLPIAMPPLEFEPRAQSLAWSLNLNSNMAKEKKGGNRISAACQVGLQPRNAASAPAISASLIQSRDRMRRTLMQTQLLAMRYNFVLKEGSKASRRLITRPVWKKWAKMEEMARRRQRNSRKNAYRPKPFTTRELRFFLSGRSVADIVANEYGTHLERPSFLSSSRPRTRCPSLPREW